MGWVVVGGPFLLGLFSLRWPFDSSEIIPPIQLMWRKPWRCAWYSIQHLLVHSLEVFMILVFCFYVAVLNKSILKIYCVPLILINNNHLSKGVRSYHYSCTLLQHLDVMRSSLINWWYVFLYQWWVKYELPPLSWVTSTWWSQFI